MPTAAQKTAHVASLTAAIARAESLETTDDMQAELDGVNARLAAFRAQVDIVTGIRNSPDYTDAQKLDLIMDTLGPQE